jgi:hypothetical protein
VSLDGLRQTRGSTATLKRPTKTKKPQGDTGVVWPTIASGIQVLLQELSAGQAQRRFGRETTASALAVFEPTQDVRGDDGLIVTAGPHSGTRWKVLAPRDVEGHHGEFGLERTTEAMI